MAPPGDVDGRLFVMWLPVFPGISFGTVGVVDWIKDPHDWSGKAFAFVGLAFYLLGVVLVVREKRRRKRDSPGRDVTRG